MIKLLQVLLPIKGTLLSWLPGFAQIRAALWAFAVSCLLGAGAVAGAWGARLGEPQRIARAAKPLCDAAAAKAKIEGLEKAVAEGELARKFRDDQVQLMSKEIARLEEEQKNAREQGPSRDDIVVPGDSPWLQQKPRRR